MAKRDSPSGSPKRRSPKKQQEKAAQAPDRTAAEQASGGEMGKLIRAKDWSKTPLGPMEAWPQSLKTAVSMILNSRHPMFIWWGDKLTNIYNDSYAPILGARHPAALGQQAPKVWHEIWDAVGPLAEKVFQKGGSTWNEKLPLDMERHGFPEETFFTFSYSPVLDDEGKIGGLFCACIEETQQVVGERRLRALRQLSNLTANASTTVEACELIARVTEEHPRDIAFGLVYLFEDPGKRARLVGHSRLEPGSAFAPSTIEAPREGAPESFWPMERAFRGETAVVCKLDPKRKLPGGAWPEPATHAMVLPFGKSGQGSALGILVLGASPRRPFDDDYQAYFELFADGAETAVSNAGAYEEESRRAELLAELDRAKTAFFSNVSHEFRTPLTLMLGPLRDLLGKPEGGVLPENRDQLQIVHRNGQRLLKLVNTLLDFSRIEAGRIQASYEPVDLAALTTDLASVFRSAIEKAGLRFTMDCSPLPEAVYVDRDMWEKVVLNLLSNAFKYTLEGEIAVSLKARDGSAVLSVRDTGTGIPEKDVPKLFDRFYRVEGASGRTHEGSGIGLALVQELVKLHGGNVAVESTAGKGSTFSVSVPFGKDHLPEDHVSAPQKVASTAIAASPYLEEALRWIPGADSPAGEEPTGAAFGAATLERSIAQSGRPVKVILADDNADMRDYVRRLLESHYTVIAVSDGEQALRAARELSPDLIVTDVMMPNLDGFGLLKALRQDPRTSLIPVVMLSARAGEESMVEGLRAGADDYLVKPFSARELMARVSGLLALARARHEAERREEELRAETTKVLESIPQGYCALDSNFRFTYANPEAERILGRGNPDLLGNELWEVFPVGEQVEARLGHAMNGRVPLRFEDYFGPWDRWFEIGAYPISDGGLAIYFRDITAHRTAEEAKDRFTFVAENSTDFIGICDADCQPTYINRAGLALVGLATLEEAQRTPVEEFFFPEDRAMVMDQFLPQVKQDGHGEMEVRFRHFKTGEAIWMTYNVVVLKDQDGNLTGLATISRNVTERKQAEQSLRESEGRFRALTSNAPTAIFVKDLEGRYTLANRLACTALGCPDAVGRTDHEMLPAEQADLLRSHDLQVISTGEPVEVEEVVGDRCFLAVKFPLTGKDGKPDGVCGVKMDITDRKQAERSLRESEERFRHMADNAPVMIWVTEANGSCSFLNKPWYEFTGQDAETGVGDSWLEALHPDDRQALREAFLPADERPRPFRVEYRLRRKDGEYRWVFDAAAPRFASDGKFLGFIGSVIDITERKQAEAALRVSEEQFRTLANTIPQLAWMAKPDGYIFWYNQRWYDYTGTTLEQMKGWGWQSVHDPQELPRVLEKFRNCLTTCSPWEDTFPLRRHDGEMRWHLSRMTALRDEHGEVVLWFGTNTDITERREMEQALREADRRKDEFLAMLGHELRNPLAAISGGMSLLESNPSVERRAWIEQMMDRQVQQLGRLVDDLLDVTRITQGKIQLRKQRVEIGERLQAAGEAVRELVDDRGHTLTVDSPSDAVEIMADPARLDQVLANLLTNAVKYTPNGGEIRLWAAVEGDEVVIRCKDNGIGLSADVLDSVFEPFVQLNTSLDRTGSGLGMGLNLVRMLARMHGGSVAASSEGPGEGSEFTVRLPLAAEEDEAASAAVEPAVVEMSDGASLRILLVDDNRDLVDSTAMLLRDAGHQVSVAYDGLTALDTAARERPQIVLLDLGMPGLNGYEIAERMRQSPELSGIRIVAISGYPPKAETSEPALFDAHLVKPVEYEQLQQYLRKQTESTPEKQAGGDDSKRILIVEDNRELALLTAELLGNRGQQVQVAFTGEQAIEEAGRFRPQVVFCDLNLPDVSGFEVARRLREDESLQPLVLVGITADHTHAYESEIESSPFDKFLSKPLAWPKVQKILRSSEGLAQASAP